MTIASYLRHINFFQKNIIKKGIDTLSCIKIQTLLPTHMDRSELRTHTCKLVLYTVVCTGKFHHGKQTAGQLESTLCVYKASVTAGFLRLKTS